MSDRAHHGYSAESIAGLGRGSRANHEGRVVSVPLATARSAMSTLVLPTMASGIVNMENGIEASTTASKSGRSWVLVATRTAAMTMLGLLGILSISTEATAGVNLVWTCAGATIGSSSASCAGNGWNWREAKSGQVVDSSSVPGQWGTGTWRRWEDVPDNQYVYTCSADIAEYTADGCPSPGVYTHEGYVLKSSHEPPSSVKIGTAALLSPATAHSAFPTSADSQHTNTFTTTSRPKEIVELARALRNDPDLIYDYVRSNVDTVWMYGLQKGAVGAIVDKSGTAFDQAHLMVELLRQANFPTASYRVGTITLNPTEFFNWTGITSATAACQLLASGGIPATVNGSTDQTNCTAITGSVSSVTLAHVWVSVTINGTSYVFDPSYKAHTFKDGLILASVTGLTAGAPIAQSGTGMSSGTDSSVAYIANVGVESLNPLLRTYANNLANYVQANLPAAEIDDIVGGSAITPDAVLRRTSLPYTTSLLRTWTGEIPDQYRTSLRVRVTRKSCSTGAFDQIIDKMIYADDIYGRRLTLGGSWSFTQASTGVSLTVRDETGASAALYSGSFPCSPGANRGQINLTVNHPYPAAADGSATAGMNYMDAALTKSVHFGVPVAIVHGWGDTGRAMVDKWGTRREGEIPPLITAGCETCGTTFRSADGISRREQMAVSWLAQSSQAARLHAAIAKSVYAHHHSIGVVEGEPDIDGVNYYPGNPGGAQETRYFIADSFDRVDIDSAFSLTSTIADSTARRAAVHAIAATMSALEGSVSAQIADLPDTSSTATRFEWGNRPPTSEDPSPVPGTPRRYYDFVSTTTAQATVLMRAENQVTTTNDGKHSASVPEIGAAEYEARRAGVAASISEYVNAGYRVVASAEAFLGPGQRAGAFKLFSGITYTHGESKQRGGAFVATKYVGGDPVEIAHITNGAKGGGGGAQAGHQAQYDPAQAADLLKSRFVDRSKALGVDMLSGGVTAVSPAAISVGNGGFPYELSASLIWTGGNQQSATVGPVSHTEPQQPWTTNWNNTLTVSGSGLEVMGEGDIRATAGTIAAFLAAQDIYKSPDVLRREVVGVLVNSWWVRQLAGNVVTVNVGADSRQFVRILDPASTTQSTWIATGSGPHATLTQSASRAIYEEPSCSGGDVSYVLTRGWNNMGVTFQVTNAHGDIQTFSPWTSAFTDGSSSYCAKLRGWRMSNWTFPQGVTVNLVYTNPSGTVPDEVPELTEVNNTLGRRITFVKSGRGGFTNGLTGADLRSVSVTGDPAAVGTVTHSEAGGAVNKFNVSIVGEKYLLTQIFDADSATVPAVQYEYDSLRRVKEARDAVALKVGGRNPYQFLLADGVRGERVDPAGGQYTVFYNSRKRPYGYMDELSRTTSVAYDSRGRVTSYIYPEGDREVFTYDARNNTTELAKWPKGCTAEPCTPAALKIKASWHPTWNKPVWIDDARNNRTDFEYYESGNGRSLLYKAKRPADADGARPEYTFTYSSRGQLLDATDPTGLLTRNAYHVTTYNLQSTSIDPAGVNSTTLFGYDVAGNLTSQTDPRLYVTEFIYDNSRRKTHTLSHNGNISAAVIAAQKVNYDDLGRVTSEQAGTAFSGTTVTAWQTLKTNTYTKTGKVEAATNGAGNTTLLTYDAMDRLAISTDPVGRRSASVYNLAGEVVCDWRAWNSATAPNHCSFTPSAYAGSGPIRYGQYSYTLNGQRQTLRDANDNVSTFEYDAFDRLKKLRFPVSTKGAGQSSATDYEQYAYDANGNRTCLRKRDNQVLNYAFDNLNRETLKDGGTVCGTASASADDVYSKYDLAGRPVWKRFGSVNGQGIDYGYDTAKRLTSETSFGRTLGFNYDLSGNRRRLTYPDTNFIDYEFDGLNRMTYVRENGATSGAGVLAQYRWDALSRRDAANPMTRGNGTTTSYGYDPASRLTSLGHDLGGTGYDATLSFGYTLASQLETRSTTNDALGWWAASAMSKAYVANGLNQYSSVSGVAFSHDLNGNLTGDGSRTFVYDIENRLTNVSGSASMTLSYDPLGRLRQTVSGGTTTQFLYDGDRLIAEYNGSGTLLRRYVHGPGVDEPVAWYEGSGLTDRRWLHSDERGSVIAHTDGAGNASVYAYGPYGEQSSWSGSRFRYTGQIMLPEVQLY